MTEIVIVIKEPPDGGFTARALGHSIFTKGDDMDALREKVRDAVRCHVDDDASRPRGMTLRFCGLMARRDRRRLSSSPSHRSGRFAYVPPSYPTQHAGVRPS